MAKLLAIGLDPALLDIITTITEHESVTVDVRQRDALASLDGVGDVDAVVLGGDRDAIRLVRRCQSQLPQVPLLVVASEKTCREVDEAMRFNPLGARGVRCVPDEPRERVREQIVQTLVHRRRRSAAARTFGALNRQLVEGVPPARVAASLLGRLLDIAPIGVVVADREGTIRELNTRATQLLGAPQPGTTLWAYLPESQHDRLHELLRTLNGDPSKQPRAAFQRERDRDPVELEISGGVLSAEAGGPGFLLVIEDVSDRHRLVRELQSASRAKDEFIAMLGHELRNPLAPIRTAIDLLRVRLGDSITRECTIIERHVEYMVHLVDDLLDVSRITQGKLELRAEPVELADVVKDAAELAQPLIEQRRHQLRVDVPASGLQVVADRRRLAQVFSNLLTNAAKYTDPAGTIDIVGVRRDARIVCSVRDNGRGISPDLLPHIFELFVQERQTIDRSQGGLGIGLAIVRSLVQLHGGEITVRSDVGVGTEFTVSLPVGPLVAARVASPRGDEAPRPGVHSRILVVDDNRDGAELMAEVLRSRYDVRIAHDGPSALEIAASFLPDVALVDIGLPGMDGWELARRLREVPGLADVKVIAVSGYGQDGDRARSAEAGLIGHLVKPVSIGALREMIERATRR